VRTTPFVSVCVCVCVVHTAISVRIDLLIRQVHTAISVTLSCVRTFSSNRIQNDKLTSTKSPSDMRARHGLRRTSFDAVRPLDELASDRIGNLSIMKQVLMKFWTCSDLISPSAVMARGTVWHRNCMD